MSSTSIELVLGHKTSFCYIMFLGIHLSNVAPAASIAKAKKIKHFSLPRYFQVVRNPFSISCHFIGLVAIFTTSGNIPPPLWCGCVCVVNYFHPPPPTLYCARREEKRRPLSLSLATHTLQDATKVTLLANQTECWKRSSVHPHSVRRIVTATM